MNLFEIPLFTTLLISFFGIASVESLVHLKSSKIKDLIIIIFSAGLLATLDLGSFIILSLFSIAIFYLVKSEVNIRKFALKLSAFLIIMLIALKEFHHWVPMEKAYVPLGVSYYFFRLISYVLDYAKNPKGISQKTTPIKFFTWVFFFPLFFAGPIQRFSLFETLSINGEKSSFYRTRIYTVMLLFIALKVLIVDSAIFPFVYKELLPVIKKGGPRPYIFLFGLLAFLHAYLDLMLYTEISKATGRLLGFKVQDNFNKPLLATNISQFWQRYHISLSSWTRDYVFFPMAAKTRNFTLASYASMMTMGMWHNISWNWFVWALCHGTLLSSYNYWRTKAFYKSLVSNPRIAIGMKVSGNIFTIAFVGTIFIFVSMPSFKVAFSLVKRLLLGT